MRYSIEPRKRRYVKGHGFLSFAKNLGTDATKVAKNLNNKYSQKLADSAKKSATDALKIACKRAIQKTAEAIGDLVGNFNADKITSISKKPASEPHFGKEVNDNDSKFKVGDHVRISKYKNIFAKAYTPNCSEEVFVIKKKIRNTVPWTYVIDNFNGEEITGTFYEKEFRKIDKQEFRIEKVIKKKRDKLYVKWERFDNSFNSWIDKKDLV